jgi:hypothetical protein
VGSELSFGTYMRPCIHRNGWRNVEQALVLVLVKIVMWFEREKKINSTMHVVMIKIALLEGSLVDLQSVQVRVRVYFVPCLRRRSIDAGDG